MGFFGDVDVSDIKNDPFSIDDGTYSAIVSDIKSGPTRDGSKQGLTVTFTVTDEEAEGKRVSRWVLIPEVADTANPTADESRSLSFLKKAIMDLGVEADAVNDVDAEDLIGNEVMISVQTKGDYTNVKRCAPVQNNSVVDF